MKSVYYFSSFAISFCAESFPTGNITVLRLPRGFRLWAPNIAGEKRQKKKKKKKKSQPDYA